MAEKDSDAQSEHLDLLLEVSLASASSLDPVRQAQSVLTALVRVFEAERAFLFLVDDAGELVPYAGCDADNHELREPSNFSRSAIHEAMAKRQIVILSSEHGQAPLQSQSAVRHDLRMVVAAPVMLRDRLLGVVYVDARFALAFRFARLAPRVLQAVANQIAIAIETARMARDESKRLAMERDLELTGALQTLLVPKSTTLRFGRLAVAGYYRPASHCGGDWWWCEQLPGGGVRVLLADVTGHGAAPAMLTATIAGCYHALRRSREGMGMDEVLGVFHDVIRSVAQGRYFMTVVGLEIDAAAETVTLWNAAGCPALIRRADGKVHMLGEPGRALGQEELEVGRVQAEVTAGDRLLVCTDGLFELERPGGRLLGAGGVGKLLASLGGLPAEAATRHIATTLQPLIGQQKDDVTFALIDVT